MHFAEFDVVVCADCRLTRLYAEPDARKNVLTNENWKKI
jgi:hypothetical protein